MVDFNVNVLASGAAIERDEGHVLVAKIADLTEKAKSYHWRIRDLVVMPVTHAELSGIDKDMKSNSAPHAGLDPATFR